MNSENVYSAFATLLGTVSGFKTVSRRVILVEDCDPGIMPALYIKEQFRKVFARSSDGIEAWDLDLDLFLYVTGTDETAPTSPIFNPLIDGICDILPPGAGLPSTPAGVQFNAFISGPITMYEGWLGLKSVVHIPITLRAPDNA